MVLTYFQEITSIMFGKDRKLLNKTTIRKFDGTFMFILIMIVEVQYFNSGFLNKTEESKFFIFFNFYNFLLEHLAWYTYLEISKFHWKITANSNEKITTI